MAAMSRWNLVLKPEGPSDIRLPRKIWALSHCVSPHGILDEASREEVENSQLYGAAVVAGPVQWGETCMGSQGR